MRFADDHETCWIGTTDRLAAFQKMGREMSDIPAEEVEGRLNAIRLIVTFLLAEAARVSGNPERLFKKMRTNCSFTITRKTPVHFLPRPCDRGRPNR
ncbi:hypothetical protein [Mesorhizobium sp. ORS 3428]|uniref:hypothetical protein n=1 Tax=Mesorhizobium sp. ORS 3428 TaxID=540997 RepID=UPI00091CA4BC|nr:hypothetical protein [Mesorhizobium sp. ORS 3428]OHV87362.1 hypothetical protein ORS3428_21750 [Mesorhizobium sp. ORS 3428]